MTDFLPHQLHLTTDQAKKLIEGITTQIPFAQMGADKGEHIIQLLPDTAMKLLGAYKSGKGVRVKLSPAEIAETRKSGRGFFDTVEKAFNSPLGKKITDKVIDRGIDYALGGGLYAGEIGMARPVKGGALGKRPPKGSPEMKEYMAKMREMRKMKKGGDIMTPIAKVIYSPPAQKVIDKVIDKAIDHFIGKGVFDTIGRAFTETWNKKPASQDEKEALSFMLNTFEPLAIKPIQAIAPPVGDIAEFQRTALKDKYGVGVSQSKPYRRAMKAKFGYTPAVIEDNKPASAFKRDPRVKPSSTEMTLSPYQSPTSPAMNPFVPMTSVQAGGTQPIGRGLF